MDSEQRKALAKKALGLCTCEGRYVWSWDSWRIFQDNTDRLAVIEALTEMLSQKVAESGKSMEDVQAVLCPCMSDGLALAAPFAYHLGKKLSVYVIAREKWIGRAPDLEQGDFVAVDLAINYGGHLAALDNILTKIGAISKLRAYGVVLDYADNEVRTERRKSLNREIEKAVVHLVTPADFPPTEVLFPKGIPDEGFVAKRVFLEEEFPHTGALDTSHGTRRDVNVGFEFLTVDEWIGRFSSLMEPGALEAYQQR